MRILMICLGNICRSPIAEGILKHKCRQLGLDWEIDSAGTGNWNFGMAPDLRSIAVTKKYGIDISAQRARTINSGDYENFDRIYAMDIAVYKSLMSWALGKEEEEKIQLIMEEVYPGEWMSVPDPFFDSSGFENVFHMLEQACEAIIEKYGNKIS